MFGNRGGHLNCDGHLLAIRSVWSVVMHRFHACHTHLGMFRFDSQVENHIFLQVRVCVHTGMFTHEYVYACILFFFKVWKDALHTENTKKTPNKQKQKNNGCFRRDRFFGGSELSFT